MNIGIYVTVFSFDAAEGISSAYVCVFARFVQLHHILLKRPLKVLDVIKNNWFGLKSLSDIVLKYNVCAASYKI